MAKTTITADLVYCAHDLIVQAGQHLIIVEGICIGVHTGSAAPQGTPSRPIPSDPYQPPTNVPTDVPKRGGFRPSSKPGAFSARRQTLQGLLQNSTAPLTALDVAALLGCTKAEAYNTISGLVVSGDLVPIEGTAPRQYRPTKSPAITPTLRSEILELFEQHPELLPLRVAQLLPITLKQARDNLYHLKNLGFLIQSQSGAYQLNPQGPPPTQPRAPRSRITKRDLIMEHFRSHPTTTIDSIVRNTRLSRAEVASALGAFGIQGKITRLSRALYKLAEGQEPQDKDQDDEGLGDSGHTTEQPNV